MSSEDSSDHHVPIDVIRAQLAETHDIHNTQIRLFQLANNPTLALSPGQRGALNFYSALPHVDEETLDTFLHELMDQTTLRMKSSDLRGRLRPVVHLGDHTATSQPWSRSDSSPEDLGDPVVRQLNQKFQWSLDANVHHQQQQPLITVDSTLYPTSAEAQSQADEFVQALGRGDENTWIRWGMVQWAQRQTGPSTADCQAELLHIQHQYYIMITHRMTEPFSKDWQEQKTVHYTSKILNMEPLVQPAWITRGFMPHTSTHVSGSFYILFKLNLQPDDTLASLSQQLGRILC